MKKTKKPYVISLTLGDNTLEGRGDSVYEALSSIKKPLKIVGKTFLIVTNGDKKATQMLMPVRAKRLFYPMAQLMLAKQIQLLLK